MIPKFEFAAKLLCQDRCRIRGLGIRRDADPVVCRLVQTLQPLLASSA